MSIKKKIILSFCIASLILLGCLCGILLYYYAHSSALKSLVERSVSRSSGTSLTIETLSYSLKPLKIQAKGIKFEPDENLRGLHLEIPDLQADFGLQGSFAHRSLTIRNLLINGFSLRLSGDVKLPEIAPKEQGPSFITKALKRMIGVFLFRDIKLQRIELAGGNVSAQLRDQLVRVTEINAKLNPDHLVEITCSSQIQWPLEKMALNAPHVHITTDNAISFVEPEIKGSLTAHNVTLKSPKINAKSMYLSAKLTYNYIHQNVLFKPIECSFKEVTLKRGYEGESIPLDFDLNAEGFLNLKDGNLNANLFHFTLSEVLELQGKINAVFGAKTNIVIDLLDSHLLPKKLIPFLPEPARRELAPLALSDPIILSGQIQGLKQQPKWSWQADLEARLKKNPFSYKTEHFKLNGLVTGKIGVKGRFPQIMLAVSIKGDKINLSSKGVELKPFQTSLYLSGKHPFYEIDDFKARIPKAKVTAGERDLLIGDINLQVRKGRLDAKNRALFLPEIHLNSSLLKNILLSLQNEGGNVSISLKGEQIDLIGSALLLDLLPQGWQFRGVDFVQIDAVQEKKGWWFFNSKLGFQKFGFQNQASSFMGEEISIIADTKGKIHPASAHIAANTSIRVHSGEILYDRIYVDLNKNSIFSSCEGKYDPLKKFLQLSSLRLGLKDILTLEINGALLHKARDRSVRLFLNIPKTSLEPPFKHFIREPFQAEKPYLSALKIGGNISVAVTLEGDGDDWMVKGHWRWHDGEFSVGDKGISAQRIDLDLPVWYQTQPPKISGAPIRGELSIQSIMLPFLPKQPIVLKLDAGPNSLFVRSPTILKIPGGEIQVGPTIVRDIFSPRFTVDTSLIINSKDINPLVSRIWSQPIKGTVTGRLDQIHLEGDALSSTGEIKAEVFGGKIVVSGLGASGMFTPASIFKLSALLKDLNLSELTNATSFGNIQGVLRGNIKDLEIAYGQPQRFDLLLETVEKKGVSQMISVKAVDNIALIGGGQSPFVGLAGGFASIFRKFPYKRIGLHASLENDMFKVNGTIREGGKEYLVKRGGFSGVNVVNQNPDNRISFKDMVKRIKRVTAKSGGPVIK